MKKEITKEEVWDLGWNPIMLTDGTVGGALSKYADVSYTLEEVRIAVLEKRFDAHTKAVGKFLNELYAIMIDPLADGDMKVEDTCAALIQAAKAQREATNGYVLISTGQLTTSDYVPSRGQRQIGAFKWALSAFGENEVRSVIQRAIRFGEEAFEGMQAAGVTKAQARAVLNYVYRRPPGELYQELGGIGISLLCFAQAANLDADRAERDELDRILSKPLDHFRQRNQAKNDAGLKVEGLTNGE